MSARVSPDLRRTGALPLISASSTGRIYLLTNCPTHVCLLASCLQPPLKLFGLAARYSSALYTAAGKAGNLPTVAAELKTVRHST